MNLQPLETQSLKAIFVNHLLEQILSNQLKAGERLPSERVIALEMQISRNVVRVGLAELTALGFLYVEPRRGTFVSDYTLDGNMAMLDAICRSPIPIAPSILRNMLDFRMTILCEAAGRCARLRNASDLARISALLEEQNLLLDDDNAEFTRIDFEFHKALYIASGNSIYIMIHNSIRTLHQTMAEEFYAMLENKDHLRLCHRSMFVAIERQRPKEAERWTREVLDMGNDVMARLAYLPQDE